MLTKEQEEQIKRICVLLQCNDPESRSLGRSLLKSILQDYNIDGNCYIRFRNRDSIFWEDIKKVNSFISADKIIIILNNLDRPTGIITCQDKSQLRFPILAPLNRSK